ncbi:hypothetical protein SMSP1_01320 [Sedimentisphaera salicampi]|nr:hypothetical protein SMSP1_01320 [Sedimentisphaera salicampi]
MKQALKIYLPPVIVFYLMVAVGLLLINLSDVAKQWLDYFRFVTMSTSLIIAMWVLYFRYKSVKTVKLNRTKIILVTFSLLVLVTYIMKYFLLTTGKY